MPKARICRSLIGRTVHFVGDGMLDPVDCTAAIITGLRGDGDRPNVDLVVLGSHAYPNVSRAADVPYSAKLTPRSWHFRD